MAWFHPRRLTLDAQAVTGGVANRAQTLLGLRATRGADIHVPIYAIETSFLKGQILTAARALARRAHVPARDVTLVDRSAKYATATRSSTTRRAMTSWPPSSHSSSGFTDAADRAAACLRRRRGGRGRDSLAIDSHSLPLVIAFVLSLSVVLLMLAFRSIAVPLTAIVMNLVSVGAALSPWRETRPGAGRAVAAATAGSIRRGDRRAARNADRVTSASIGWPAAEGPRQVQRPASRA